MSTRAEREATLAKAEADWRLASNHFDEAQGVRDKANAAWNKVIIDWRKASPNRRKAGKAWDRIVPDRRIVESDRRAAEADFIAFSKRMADQHDAYLAWSEAEAEWVAARARLKSAAEARDKAIAALGGLNCAGWKARLVRLARLGEALVAKLRKALRV